MSSNEEGKGIIRFSNNNVNDEISTVLVKKSRKPLLKTKKQSRFGGRTSEQTSNNVEKTQPRSIQISAMDTINADSNWSLKMKLSKSLIRAYGKLSNGKVANAIFQDATGTINCVFYDKMTKLLGKKKFWAKKKFFLFNPQPGPIKKIFLFYDIMDLYFDRTDNLMR
jgi:hypothetical protein